MAGGFTIKHRDEFESMEGSGDSTWRLARKALGTSAFGFNLVEVDPGGQIPEHDEAESGQVELYVDPRGRGGPADRGRGPPGAGRHLRLDRAAGQPHDPQPLRGAGHGAAVGVQPEGGFQPSGWA